MSEIIHAYDDIRRYLDGRDTAEIEIEARRDAIEAGHDIQANPYPAGTFASLCYTSECHNEWIKRSGK